MQSLPQKSLALHAADGRLAYSVPGSEINLSFSRCQDFICHRGRYLRAPDVVLRLRDRFKMIWADAKSHAAQMIKMQALGDRTIRILIGISMRQSLSALSSTDSLSSVPINGCAKLPDPALSNVTMILGYPTRFLARHECECNTDGYDEP